VRTLVVSDLHLGTRRQPDVLRGDGPRAALTQLVRGCGRLVLLGDVVELRHGPWRQALAAAEPVLRDLGQALGGDGEVVLVPGNHDHGLLGGWLERRATQGESAALGLEAEVPWRPDEPLGEIASWLSPAAVRVAYPGVWLREDVYATHGHYSDRHITVPILERLGAGLMTRVIEEPDGGPRRAEDYEATLAPMYAWIDAVAQAGGVRGRGGGGLQVRAWRSLQPTRAISTSLRSRFGRRVRTAGLSVVFPALVGALNRTGIGPLHADVSGPALRSAGLSAFAESLERLRARPAFAIFGHTHRAGPLPGDEQGEWRTHAGGAILNCGSWVHAGALLGADPRRSPYRPGFAVLVEDDGAPRLVNLLDGEPAPARG